MTLCVWTSPLELCELLPRWLPVDVFVLNAAGIYNIAWGTFVVLFPEAPFRWAGMPPINYMEVWQCVGMIVGVYGVGYIIAARDPLRHWPIILVGLLGKVFGPIGMFFAVVQGRLPMSASLTCVTNDLLWWVPFGMILWAAYGHRQRAGVESVL